LADEAQLDAAIAAISDPARLAQAQSLVAQAAPALQKVLAGALSEGGWFDTAHNAAVREAITEPDQGERLRRIRVLFAEETRLSMLVGVAVGLELARELGYDLTDPDPDPEPEPLQED
jgi:hypothetical protein